MQYNNKDYKPKLHDRWRALTVKNPYATQLVTAAYEDNGIVYGICENGQKIPLEDDVWEEVKT